jgi:hypothetical protein
MGVMILIFVLCMFCMSIIKQVSKVLVKLKQTEDGSDIFVMQFHQCFLILDV